MGDLLLRSIIENMQLCCANVCIAFKLLYSLTSSIIMMSKRINYSGKIVGYLFVLYFVV